MATIAKRLSACIGAGSQSPYICTSHGGAIELSVSFHLYRAVEGLGPMTTWDRMHTQPLGTRRELQRKLEEIFPAQRWECSSKSAWACYEYDDARFPREVRLMGAEDDVVEYVIAYSGPAAIRTIMTALGLNYCYVPETDELCHPFATGDSWPGEAERCSVGDRVAGTKVPILEMK